MHSSVDVLFENGNPGMKWWMLATVVAAAVAVYANTLGMGFVWDDVNQILKPSPLRSLENIAYFFGNSVTAGQQFGNQTPYYRPVFSLSIAVDYSLWGLNPFGYHLTNILLHAGCSALVLAIACELFAVPLAALSAGLLYALHPMHGEAVAYVSARNELLCGFFLTAAFLLYIRSRPRPTILSMSGVMLFFFAALLSKEMAVTLPLIIVFYEISAGESPFRKAVIRSLPFFAILGVYILLRSAMLNVTTWDSPPFPIRCYTGVGIVASYLGLLLFPFNPKTFYDIAIKWEFMQADVLIPLVIILMPILFGILMFKKDKIFFFSIAWIYIALIPASGAPALIIPAYLAERYLYIPSIGFALLCGRVITVALQWKTGQATKSFHPALAASSVLLIAYSCTTFIHNYSWTDEPTYYRTMISDAPGHQLGYDLLGGYHGRRNENSEMAKNYMTSMSLARKEQIKLGDSYLKYGYYDRAEDAFIRMVKRGYGDSVINAKLAAIKEAKRQKSGGATP
jgi:hypothetical protein